MWDKLTGYLVFVYVRRVQELQAFRVPLEERPNALGVLRPQADSQAPEGSFDLFPAYVRHSPSRQGPYGVEKRVQGSLVDGHSTVKTMRLWMVHEVLFARSRSAPGSDMAVEQLHVFIAAGVRGVYLVLPILKGGVRNYDAAQAVLEEFLGQ